MMMMIDDDDVCVQRLEFPTNRATWSIASSFVVRTSRPASVGRRPNHLP